MVSNSLPTLPGLSGLSSHPLAPHDTATADELLDTLDRLTAQGDASGIRQLLLDHRTAFAGSASRPWIITPEAGLDLRGLFDGLDTRIALPPMRLQGFTWHGDDMCSSVLCHPGLRDLTLHECAVGDDAWTAAAEHARDSFTREPSNLRRLAFTFDPPDLTALGVDTAVSSGAMAAWTSQLHRLEDLTLSGFHHHTEPYHMSYGHVLAGLRHLPLRRLSLQGFLPTAFCSPRIHEALPALANANDGRAFHLALQDWIWMVDIGNDEAELINQATEQSIQQLVAFASGHLTVDLQNMHEARGVASWVGQGLGARHQDFSLRVDCPEDALVQDTLPPGPDHAVLDELAGMAQAGQHHLCGLHFQLIDATSLPISVQALIDDAPRLHAVTVAMRESGQGAAAGARRKDAELARLLRPLASLGSLEVRSSHDMVGLRDLKECLAALPDAYV